MKEFTSHALGTIAALDTLHPLVYTALGLGGEQRGLGDLLNDLEVVEDVVIEGVFEVLSLESLFQHGDGGGDFYDAAHRGGGLLVGMGVGEHDEECEGTRYEGRVRSRGMEMGVRGRGMKLLGERTKEKSAGYIRLCSTAGQHANTCKSSQRQQLCPQHRRCVTAVCARGKHA